MKYLNFLFLVLAVVGCTSNKNQSQDTINSISLQALDKNADELDPGVIDGPAEPPKPVDLKNCQFNGTLVLHSAGIMAFQSSSVPFGSECQVENRICNDGALSGNFNFTSCGVDIPKDCLFNGSELKHGNSIVAYSDSSVNYGSRCADISEVRTCNDGALSGRNEFNKCEVGVASACLFNGKTISHGENIKVFETAEVNEGQICREESRVCENGSLSGSYQYESCTITSVAATSYEWEFPTWCGGFAGFGYAMHSSRYSNDGGKSWNFVVGSNAPPELKGIWDFMMKKFGSGYCLRPDVKYSDLNADGYYRILPEYMPTKSQCQYQAINVCNGYSRGTCTSYAQELGYVCN